LAASHGRGEFLLGPAAGTAAGGGLLLSRPIAREIDAWSRANKGLIRFQDLATHTSRIEEPVQADYRGYTIYKCGCWTQGPYLLQALRLLEGFDLARLGFQEPATIHAIVEAMKLALADRDVHYGDPLFVEVRCRNCCPTATRKCGVS